MALNQAQLDGAVARAVVRQRWPNATSSYVNTTAAEVYDPSSCTILGEATALEHAVEHAWIAAAANVQKRE
jgi:hypothetical protein